MSFGGHYSGGPNGRSNHDNGRDRDRDSNRPERDKPDGLERNDRSDKSYNSRHGSSKRFPPQSSHGDPTSAGSGQRRQDGGRDFHGYRNGFNRTDTSDRTQGNSISFSNYRRRDKNPHYDSYQGNKSRPASSGKPPRGPASSQNASTGRETISFRATPNVFKNDTPRDVRRNSIEGRRPTSRKQDWESPVHAKSRPTQSHASSAPRASELDLINRISKSPSKDFEAGIRASKKPMSASIDSRNDKDKQSAKFPRPHTSFSKSDSPFREPAVPKNDSTSAPNPNEVRRSSNAGIVNVDSSKMDHRDSESTKPNAQSSNPSVSNNPDLRKGQLSRIFDDEDGAQDKSASPDASRKLSTHDASSKNVASVDSVDVPRSPPSNGFDTSVLSPVGSTASDENLVQTLNIVPESKTDGENDQSDDLSEISEAETIKGDFTSEGSAVLRKESREMFRRRAKRRTISDSDDEEPYSDGGSDKGSAINLESLARQDEAHFTKSAENSDESEDSGDSEDYENSEQSEDQTTLSKREPKRALDHEQSTSNRGKATSVARGKNSKSNYKIKRDSTGRSQLHKACKKGDLLEVKRLLDNGASANDSDFGGFTCLHEAALAGHTDIVECLIQYGADVNRQALEAGDFETPLMDAAENKHVSTVEVLLKNGADPHIRNNEGYSTLTKLFHLQEEDDEYEEVIKAINDFSPPQPDSGLNMAAPSTREIIDDPCDNYFSQLVKKKSNSLIFKYAAQGNKESAAEDFVTNGISLSKMPDVLNLAARNGHVELVDILLALNPGSFNINQLNKIGVTVLLASVGRGHYEVVKFLLSKGANPRIKRVKDSLTALDIAKHSAQYDPREVLALEESIRGKQDAKSSTKTTSVSDNNLGDVKSSKSSKGSTSSLFSKDLKGPSVTAKPENTLDSLRKPVKEPVSVPKALEEKAHVSGVDIQGVKNIKLDGASKSASPDGHKRRSSFDEPSTTKKAKLEQASMVANVENSEFKKATSPLPNIPEPEDAVSGGMSEQNSVGISPVPHDEDKLAPVSSASLKVQEEQRLRAAEQAKLWQEKVQAKKKARKEMFLLAEKEKEKKKKEEEERRLELQRKQEIEQREQRRKEEARAKKLLQELDKKKQMAKEQYILQNYPIGLREAVLDGTLEREKMLKYTPMYVFKVADDDWVIDLQVSLILSIPIPEVHSAINCNLGSLIDNEAKDKLWCLFFTMVGVGRNDVIESNGLEKFRGLELKFLRLGDVKPWMESKFQDVHRLLWVDNCFASVDLESLEPFHRNDTRDSNGVVHRTEVGFMPPKFRSRGDVIKTIQTASSPLW